MYVRPYTVTTSRQPKPSRQSTSFSQRLAFHAASRTLAKWPHCSIEMKVILHPSCAPKILLFPSLTNMTLALITLTSVDPPSSLIFPDRRLFLTKEKPSMDIGRTSKRNASFEAAKNNAWFDSAVMSREHARLKVDTDKQVRLSPCNLLETCSHTF